MKKKKEYVIPKPFGFFVVISVGIVMMAYVALGLVAIEIDVDRAQAKNKQRAFHLQQQSEPSGEVEMFKKSVGVVSGEVVSINNGVVTIESNIGDGDLSNVQLNVKRDDLKLVRVGDGMTATLVNQVLVSEVEDGALEVSNIVVKEKI